MNIVIIEDEPMTSEDMEKIMSDLNIGINVVSIIRSVKEGILFFKQRPVVDLIFSDIQLGDGLSLEIFKSVRFQAPIIFCTAYDEYALDAIKSNGIEYILKPFTKESIEGAINKYNQLKNYLSPQPDLEKLLASFRTSAQAIPQPRSILVYYKDKVMPIKIEHIALFQVDGEVNRLICFDGRSFIISQSLDELEQVVNNQFFRVNRQSLVNRQAVLEASQYFGRKYVVKLTIALKETIVVGKSKVTAFLNWLEG